MADTLAELAPADPDAQQTVNDFLDYTEFFPSDLIRSLTLIRNLDESYSNSTKSVHELTTTYGVLPTLPADSRPNPQALREHISLALDHAIRCRESAFAEASRLYEVADRHYNRITSIKRKLHALPKPPSRDPTPVPPSPQAIRAQKPGVDRTPRLTLHLDGARQPSARHGGPGVQRQRSRKITIPGEVLPPPNPDSPPPSTVSDWESSRPCSPVDVNSQIKLPTEKIHRIKVPKLSNTGRVRPPGVMGTNVHSAVAGISVSNALAQLEPPPADAKLGSKYRPWYKLTEYEMAKLRKRMKKNAIWNPSDTMVRRELAELGRGHSNFLKAKADAARTGQPLLNEEPVEQGTRPLVPGEVEMRAIDDEEMKLVNRGMKLNEAKKLKKETQARELAAQNALEMEEAGRKIKVAAQTATEIHEAGRKIKDAGDMFKNLFSRPPGEIGETVIVNPIFEKRKESEPKPVKKRKRELSPEVKAGSSDKPPDAGPPEPVTKPAPKKLKLALPAPPPIPLLAPAPTAVMVPSTRTTTIQIPLAPAAPSPPKQAPAPIIPPPPPPPEPVSAPPKKPSVAIADPPTPVSSARPQRTSAAAQKQPTPAPQVAPNPASEPAQPTEPLRPRSRRSSVAASAASKAASAEPQPKRESLRRSSNVNSPSVSTFADAKPSPAPAPAPRTSGRRSKRPAPGIVTGDEDGGTKVSVGKRAVPRKGSRKESKTEGKVEEKPVEEEWGDVDPDEPRYCFCNRVSFGTMIACENEDCEIEWFHLGCVGLEEIPGRRVKWFCPDCRKKLHIDEHGNAAASSTGTGRKR